MAVNKDIDRLSGVENMNGRLRRYIPRGTDPDSFSESDLFSLACRFNTTPRQCLGFKTPAEIFFAQALHLKSETTTPGSWGRRKSRHVLHRRDICPCLGLGVHDE